MIVFKPVVRLCYREHAAVKAIFKAMLNAVLRVS